MAKSAIGHGMVKMNPRHPNETELFDILKKAL